MWSRCSRHISAWWSPNRPSRAIARSGIFARILPTTLDVEAVNTTLAGRGLGAAWADGTLPWLIVHVVVLGSLGWITYLHTLRRARREGGLSPR